MGVYVMVWRWLPGSLKNGPEGRAIKHDPHNGKQKAFEEGSPSASGESGFILLHYCLFHGDLCVALSLLN